MSSDLDLIKGKEAVKEVKYEKRERLYRTECMETAIRACKFPFEVEKDSGSRKNPLA